MPLNSTIEHTGSREDMIRFLRELADTAEGKGKGKLPLAVTRAESAGLRRAAEELSRWTPTGNGQEPAFGGYQPGPRTE